MAIRPRCVSRDVDGQAGIKHRPRFGLQWAAKLPGKSGQYNQLAVVKDTSKLDTLLLNLRARHIDVPPRAPRPTALARFLGGAHRGRSETRERDESAKPRFLED